MTETTDNRRKIVGCEETLDFIFGGNARFTLVSRNTGTRYTYRMKRADTQGASDVEPMFFASLLTGPDNETDYQYLGFTREGWHDVGLRAGRKGSPNHPAYKALDWALRMFRHGAIPAALEVWHEGRCCRCGRALTVPESIESGIGPECAKKAHA